MSKRSYRYREHVVDVDLRPERRATETDDSPVFVATVAVDGEALGEDRLRLLARDQRQLVLESDGRLSRVHVARSRDSLLVAVRGRVYRLQPGEGGGAGGSGKAGSPEIRSPMPGKIVKILVEVGQAVAAGDAVAILEAMKMENRLHAEIDGVVAAIEAAEGDRVEDGDLLIRIEARDDA